MREKLLRARAVGDYVVGLAEGDMCAEGCFADGVNRIWINTRGGEMSKWRV